MSYDVPTKALFFVQLVSPYFREYTICPGDSLEEGVSCHFINSRVQFDSLADNALYGELSLSSHRSESAFTLSRHKPPILSQTLLQGCLEGLVANYESNCEPASSPRVVTTRGNQFIGSRPDFLHAFNMHASWKAL